MTRPIPHPANAIVARRICERLRMAIAVAGLVLIRQTRGLWFGSAEVFPQVPLVSWGLESPAWLDAVFAWLMVGSLGTLLFCFRRDRVARIASLTFAGALAGAVLLDQQRLQPWAWEFAILLLVMALLPARQAVVGLRWVVASIYLHSGLSKSDVTFLETYGENLLWVIQGSFGWDLAEAPVMVRRGLVALLPLGEIGVAIGLCIPRTRQFAKWGAIGMHVCLLWILGPWGLDHQPGVLIWNAYFIVQNGILFSRFPKSEALDSPVTGSTVESPRWRISLGYLLVAIIGLLPFLEPFGLFDHWPAWAVYASRPERTLVYVAEDRLPDLPPEVREFLSEGETPPDEAERFLAGKPAWRRLRIDRWSLAATKAPAYPQDRFQLGVALALARDYQLGEAIRVDILSPADRWTGQRTHRVLEGQKAIRETAENYRLNALPR
ncbi:MAG: hypothetical protein KDA84_06550 [Planctomycetaceae bacterium]|nr:hypothetical protein [Planctomycetaceae bacterium]